MYQQNILKSFKQYKKVFLRKFYLLNKNFRSILKERSSHPGVLFKKPTLKPLATHYSSSRVAGLEPTDKPTTSCFSIFKTSVLLNTSEVPLLNRDNVTFFFLHQVNITGKDLEISDFELVTGNCNDKYDGNLLTISQQIHTAQKMKFSINDFFSKFDQICSFLRIWSHLLKKS